MKTVMAIIIRSILLAVEHRLPKSIQCSGHDHLQSHVTDRTMIAVFRASAIFALDPRPKGALQRLLSFEEGPR